MNLGQGQFGEGYKGNASRSGFPDDIDDPVPVCVDIADNKVVLTECYSQSALVHDVTSFVESIDDPKQQHSDAPGSRHRSVRCCSNNQRQLSASSNRWAKNLCKTYACCL
jgi:hypothetical protein